MRSLAFISLFDQSPQGNRAKALADALEEHYDVTRYGYGDGATSLLEFAGLESILFYYLFDDPLFRKIMTYSRHRTGYIYVDDIDLMKAKYGWYPSLAAECESRGIDPAEKRYLLRHEMSGYPPGTGFYGIEEDDNGRTFRWTKRSFSLYIGSETDLVEIDVYTDYNCLLSYNQTISVLRSDTEAELSLTTDEEVVKFSVFKRSIGRYKGDENRPLGIRLYEIRYKKDGKTNAKYCNSFTAEPPRRLLLDKKPLRPDRGFVISPHNNMVDTPAAELLRFTAQNLQDEHPAHSEEVLFLTHRATRTEVEDLLDDLSEDVNPVFLRSEYCDVDRLVAEHDEEFTVKTVKYYDQQPACVIYPYDNDYGVPRLAKFTPVDVLTPPTVNPSFVSSSYEKRIHEEAVEQAEGVSNLSEGPKQAAEEIKDLIA